MAPFHHVLVVLAATAAILSLTQAAAVTPRCQAILNVTCNADTACNSAMKADGYELPTVALFDTDEHHGAPQWRCYSLSSLNADHTRYVSGAGYCSREDELQQALATCQSNTTFVNVFTPGELGYPCIRIPSILLGGDNLTLLAFAECRNWTGDGCEPSGNYPTVGQNSNKDICMKTSSDGGSTWSALQVLFRNAGQPSPVWDRVRNTLVLNYVQLVPGDNLQSVSLDYGKTWSPPVSLKPTLGAAVVSEVGPGVGIQLSSSNAHAGRLLFIGHHGAYQYDSVWYSDDGGHTYTMSQTNFTSMDEAQLVELPDGRVLANMRNAHLNACKCRGIAVSHDGGASFGAVSFDPVLVSPVCMATILRAKDGLVYFANPASTIGRVNGTLRRSVDGLTWSASTVVWPGDYAYSCLTDVAAEGKIGLLWETNMDGCSGASCRSVFSMLSTTF